MEYNEATVLGFWISLHVDTWVGACVDGEAGKLGGRMWGKVSTTKRYIFKINVAPFFSLLSFGRSAGSVIQ